MKKTIAFIALFILTGCSANTDWMGFYYPNQYDLTIHKEQGGFSSIEECRDWIANVSGDNENYDYECGYKCEYKAEYGANICKKTER